MLTSGERVREGREGRGNGYNYPGKRGWRKIRGFAPLTERKSERNYLFLFSLLPIKSVDLSFWYKANLSFSPYFSLFRGIKFVKEELSGKPHPRRAAESSPILVT